MSPHDFFAPSLGGYVRYCLGFCLRYFALAGSLYAVSQVWFRREWLTYRIQQTFPPLRDMGHEIRWSMSNTLCSGLSTLLVYELIRDGRTRMYFQAGERGWAYFGLSILFGIVGYDSWFYWQHRLLHTRWLFRRAHWIHHRVTNPTPFATFAHHPIETFMGNVFFVLFVVLVPVHPVALGLAGAFIFAAGLVAHLGYELYPRGFTRQRVFQWVNTSTHHNMHHSLVRSNYGLWLNGWDRLMGTNDEAYHETFEAITRRTRPLPGAWHPPATVEVVSPGAAQGIEIP